MNGRGQNVHMPVVNVVEKLLVVKLREPDPDTALQDAHAVSVGAEIPTPAQVVPAQTAPTLYEHWQQWSFLGAGGPGSKLTSVTTPEVQASWGEIPYKSILVTHDNLHTNACLLRLAEDDAQEHNNSVHGDNDRSKVSLADLRCCGHSAVLCQQPLVEAEGSMPTMLVRLAHILESGKRWQDYIDALQHLALTGFERKVVVALPDECAQWEAENRAILARSRALMDLTPEQESLVVSALNCSWAQQFIRHYCLRDGCPWVATAMPTAGQGAPA